MQDQYNIRYWPKHYEMSDSLKQFFTTVTASEDLQRRLYLSRTLSDIAALAQSRGYDVRGAEILKAQAGRALAILDEEPQDIPALLSGKKPKTGCQWGRGGGGFLDHSGRWLMTLADVDSTAALPGVDRTALDRVVASEAYRSALLAARDLNHCASILEQTCGVVIQPADLLLHIVDKIFHLSDEQADQLSAW